MDCGFPRKFKMVSKFTTCDKWCASPSDEHIHDGSDCDGNVGSIFHARTNQEDSTIPSGKCVLLTKSTKDSSKCKYTRVPKDKLELGDDTSEKVDFNEAKDYILEGDIIADGIISIKAVKVGKYLEKDGNHLKAPKQESKVGPIAQLYTASHIIKMLQVTRCCKRQLSNFINNNF